MAASAPATRRARQPRTATVPQRITRRAPRRRIRWDRVGRVGMLIVLTVVASLYVQHALAYLSTRAQAQRERAIVSRLERENAVLVKKRDSLSDPATIEQDARALGMVKPGERAYVITGMRSR